MGTQCVSHVPRRVGVLKIDGHDVSRKSMREELTNVCKNYPLFPGDTISHLHSRACAKAGWIVRDVDGNWIPTARGLKEYTSKP